MPKQPILASTALRRDLAPATPGPGSARWAAAIAGLAGLALTLPVSGPRGFGLPVAGALGLLLLLGVLPLPYAARASALATVAGSGLLVVTWHALIARVASPAPLVLRIGVIVLAMALLYRGWHRASLLARALVALGIALCAGWVWMSGALGAVLVLGSAVQSWLGPVLAVLLVLLLMLSLLAFMDSRTTGGCAVWAALLLGWYVAYGWVDVLALVWRRSGARAWSSPLVAEQWVALVSAPLFTVVLSTALAQLLAVANAAEPE